jgi:adenosylmethionine-8-amino-7-oxononanoate aminotransferase
MSESGNDRMWNPFASMGALAGRQLAIVDGRGATVRDADGREYLDAIASLWYCNVGHGREELAEAAAAQMRRLETYQTFEYYTNPPAQALAARLAAIAPMPGARVFFTAGGGSDAVDTAGKLARAYWAACGRLEKREILSRANAYHGMNAYGTSLAGIAALKSAYGPLVESVEQVPWDDAAALTKAIERIGADRVAAFFAEPVVGAGGVLFPPDGYLDEVRRICAEQDVLFVADEVVTGFGRVGEWFGSQRWGIEPDLVTSAKGLTSGYLPLGAVLAGERVAEPFFREGGTEIFRHGYTYSGHATACAVALANLDIIEREELLARVRALEPVVARAFGPLAEHPLVAEVRFGAGLLAAVEVTEAARARRPDLLPALVAAVRDRGVLTRGLQGRALQFSPPLVVSEEDIDRIASAYAEGLDAVA